MPQNEAEGLPPQSLLSLQFKRVPKYLQPELVAREELLREASRLDAERKERERTEYEPIAETSIRHSTSTVDSTTVQLPQSVEIPPPRSIEVPPYYQPPCSSQGPSAPSKPVILVLVFALILLAVVLAVIIAFLIWFIF